MPVDLSLLKGLSSKLAAADADSRLRFSHCAAIYLIETGGPVGVSNMVAGGPDEFRKVAGHFFKPQAFTNADLDRIFAMLVYHVQRLANSNLPHGEN
jgi:hypothetical protein